MNFDDFTGEAQHRLELANTGETVRSIRATLLPLGRRIPAGNAEDFAASLPMEIGWYMTGAVHEHGQRFGWDEYLEEVCEITGLDPAEAAFHARVVIDLAAEAVPESDVRDLRAQLPGSDGDEDWGNLFELIDAGGWQEAHDAQTGGGPQAESDG